LTGAPGSFEVEEVEDTADSAFRRIFHLSQSSRSPSRGGDAVTKPASPLPHRAFLEPSALVTVRCFLSMMTIRESQFELVRVAVHSLDELLARQPEQEQLPGAWLKQALLSVHTVLRQGGNDTDLQSNVQMRVMEKHVESRLFAAKQVLTWCNENDWCVSEALDDLLRVLQLETLQDAVLLLDEARLLT